MQRKDRPDAFGGAVLLGVTLPLAPHQIIVQLVNAGLQPVFLACLRSSSAIIFVWAWLIWQGRPLRRRRERLPAGLPIGAVFAAGIRFRFIVLDHATVGRASLIMYSMPVRFAILAQFGPGERITPRNAPGPTLAFAGQVPALLGCPATGQAGLAGDLCEPGADWGRARTAVFARRTLMRAEGPEVQPFWMVLVAAPILLLLLPRFGPLIRDLHPLHLAGLLFRSSIVVAGGFITRLGQMSVHPSATVASFSFPTPILAILPGAVIFAESVTWAILGAAGPVAVGIVPINRPAHSGD